MWAPRDDPAEQAERERLARTGQNDPTDWRITHDERLAEQDRLAEKAPAAFAHLAYREQPALHERREHYDETRVRNLLHPRRPDSQVTPLGRRAA